jgi:hypothetical protein
VFYSVIETRDFSLFNHSAQALLKGNFIITLICFRSSLSKLAKRCLFCDGSSAFSDVFQLFSTLNIVCILFKLPRNAHNSCENSPCFYRVIETCFFWAFDQSAPMFLKAYFINSYTTSFPGLQCEDEGRDEEALVWAGQFCILIGLHHIV